MKRKIGFSLQSMGCGRQKFRTAQKTKENRQKKFRLVVREKRQQKEEFFKEDNLPDSVD